MPAQLPSFIEHRGRRVLLKYHKFNSGRGQAPANSLAALDEVLGAGVEVIEFDISLLADGEFALLHDARLERETDGSGALNEIDSAQLAKLHLRGSSDSPATLSPVVERLRAHDRPVKVQVDLKEIAPLEPVAAAALLDALAYLRENDRLSLVVGCMADWNLRELRRLDPSLAVGNDPVFYLHAPTPGLQVPVPTRVNAYGYMDDHPLGYRRAMPVARYLRDRLDGIIGQVSGTSEFYLHKGFVAQALADGFDPIEHAREQAGLLVDVWTINRDHPKHERDLLLALKSGVDQITSDTPVDLAELAGTLGQ